MVERFWAALENNWSPLELDTIANTINIAKKVVWKGMLPIVNVIDKTYQQVEPVDSEDFKALQKYMTRNPNISHGDVLK